MKIFLVLESACTDEVNGLNKPISYVSGAILRQNIQKKQFLLPFIHIIYLIGTVFAGHIGTGGNIFLGTR